MSLRRRICARVCRRSRKIGSGLKWEPTMPFKRGDVMLVLFPDSNLRTAKRRPALVVQANNLGTQLPQTVIAMITSNMARAGHSSRVTLSVSSSAGKHAGILMDSVVMTDNLTTVRDSEIDRTLG